MLHGAEGLSLKRATGGEILSSIRYQSRRLPRPRVPQKGGRQV